MAAADTSADASSTTGGLRGAFEDASEGDEVQYADDQYDWANPMTIVKAPPEITWEAAVGADWFVRILTLEGRNGGHYKAIYADVGTGPARTKSSRVDPGSPGNRTERGEIQQFELVGTDEADETDDVDNSELPDDVTRTDVEAAIREHKDGGKADLGEVATELDLTPGRARTILVQLGHYGSEVCDVVRRAGGGGGR